LIARSFSAVAPSIAARSASLDPGVVRMWVDGRLGQGNGKSVPRNDLAHADLGDQVDASLRESGKGDAAIRSQALGLLYPGMKRSQTPALTVPYVVAGLCAKPAK